MDLPITLRAAQSQDEQFLFGLYKAVRAGDFALMPLPPSQLDLLIKMQYDAQKRGYESQFPNSQHSIVLSGQTQIGRIMVFRDNQEHRLVDISLLPDCRGRGIGSALVKQLILDAEKAGVPLRCSVAVTNAGSLRFHQRLGFEISSQDPVYYQLQYQASHSLGGAHGG